MSEVMIRQWLAEFAKSVARRDLKRHMAFVSKKVYVYGLPGKKTVDHIMDYFFCQVNINGYV